MVFLATDDAGFITGSTLTVNGEQYHGATPSYDLVPPELRSFADQCWRQASPVAHGRCWCGDRRRSLHQQGTRDRYPGDAARPRGRGDRIRDLFATVHQSVVDAVDGSSTGT